MVKFVAAPDNPAPLTIPKKFLIIQTAFIGDVILATGLVKKLKEFYPDSPIDFLVKKGNESILEGHPMIRNVIVFDKKKKIKSLYSIIREIRSEKYDILLNLHRFGSSGLIAFLSGAKYKTGFDKNPFSFSYDFRAKHIIEPEKRIHEIERNHLLIKNLTDEKAERPYLYIPEKIESRIREFTTEPFICIAPASVWFTKQYPEEKWVEFLKSISKIKVFFLGGPGDIELCSRIMEKSGVHGEILAGKLSLLESAALMKKAKMNYVNDSGPLHLCSAVNAPVTSIFCSTVPGFGFYPLSDNNYIIQTEETLKCRPCGLHGYKNCPEGHFLCALSVKTSFLTSIQEKSVK